MLNDGGEPEFSAISLALNCEKRPSQNLASFGVSIDDVMQVTSMFEHCGLWKLDLSNWELKWSPDVFAIHGMQPHDGPIDIDFVMGLYHPEDRGYLSEVLAYAVQHLGAFRYVLRMRQAQSDYALVRCTGMYRTGATGFGEIVGTFEKLMPATQAIGTAK